MIVLDTHTWVWWETGAAALSPRAKRAISRADKVGVCTISVYEVGQLVARGRVRLTRPLREWVAESLARDRVEILQLTVGLALDATQLALGGDPFDRIIYATARRAAAKLVTRDERIHAFDPELALW